MKLKTMKLSVLGVFIIITMNANVQQKQGDGQQRQGPPPPEKVIERFDTDADEKISLEELNADEKGVRLAQRFAVIDANDDGFIDEPELQAFYDARKNKSSNGNGRKGKGEKKGKSVDENTSSEM